MPASRRLVATTVAALLLLVLGGLALAIRHGAGWWMTPLGLISPLDLVATALAMGVGGFIAQRGFLPIAVGLVVVVGLASAIAGNLQAPSLDRDMAHWLLANALLQMVLSAVVAAAAAYAGERIAARRAGLSARA